MTIKEFFKTVWPAISDDYQPQEKFALWVIAIIGLLTAPIFLFAIGLFYTQLIWLLFQ